jgi:hypothetical protein
MAGKALVQFKPKEMPPLEVQHWRKRKHNPWYTCCDTRAVLAVMIHLYSEDSAKNVVCMNEVMRWISVGDFGCLSTVRRADVVEAFEGCFDTSSTILLAIATLVKERALIAECGEYYNQYRVKAAAARQLSDVHQRLRKSAPTG